MDTFTKTLRNVQVILFALVSGLTLLSLVSIYMVFQVKPGGFAAGQGPQWNAVPLLTAGFLGISLLNMMLVFVLPPLLLNNQIRQWTRSAEPVGTKLDSWESSELAWIDRVPLNILGEMLQRFQSNRILCASLCEAAGMLSAIAYLIEGHPASLAMIVLAIVVMFLHIPTKASLGQWLFSQIERLQREKS